MHRNQEALVRVVRDALDRAIHHQTLAAHHASRARGFRSQYEATRRWNQELSRHALSSWLLHSSWAATQSMMARVAMSIQTQWEDL